MDGPSIASRRWTAHAGHGPLGRPHRRPEARTGRVPAVSTPRMITLDGSEGEGGGQILRTALSLSLITGRPFRIAKIRANRTQPGLRPQHLSAVRAAAALGKAKVEGDAVGSRELTFRPGEVEPRDLSIDIGTAGATGMVLHTLHLPMALKADGPVRLTLTGGTFNTKAPSFPFLERTWAPYMGRLGLRVAVTMPTAGFYPVGGGRLEAWIEPAERPRAVTILDRPPLGAIRGIAGVANLPGRDIAGRMRDRAAERLAEAGLEAEIECAEWPARGRGAALAIWAEHGPIVSTFVGLGERGKPAEAVAEEAAAELIGYEENAGAVDAHSADQLLMPLALAEGRSVYAVGEVTEHLRTNSRTIRAFLDVPIRIEEPKEGRPGRVIVW